MPHPAEPSRVLTQFSVIDALVVGLFDGVFPVEEVAAAGDVGIGCGDSAEGELVVLDGVFRLFRGDDSVTVLDPDALLAFAEVARFSAAAPAAEVVVGSIDELLTEVGRLAGSENHVRGVRLRGRFGRVDLRRPLRQEKPYRTLAQTVDDQRESSAEDVEGTVVGFVAPHFLQGITVAGPHLHFVDDTGTVGGHVLGLGDVVGTLTVDVFTEIRIRLPDTAEYAAADLRSAEAGADEVIRRAESEHGAAGRP